MLPLKGQGYHTDVDFSHSFLLPTLYSEFIEFPEVVQGEGPVLDSQDSSLD